ncbi:MAG: PAS domain S-box protein [Brasilonema angustatum HA4187-MV1]|jgi:hypothetical protein|nr:PAS domain S-box protein [Brasilonema angustatum HA4187-MV1]
MKHRFQHKFITTGFGLVLPTFVGVGWSFQNTPQALFLSIKQSAIQSRIIFIFALVGFSLSLVLVCSMCYFLNRQITERQHAEQALRESEQRFQFLTEATFEGIIIHEMGKIIDANQSFAKLFGYETQEVIGMSAKDFLTPESLALVMKNIASGYDSPYEVTGVKKNGTTFPLEVVGKNSIYQDRKVRMAVGRDITKRKQAEGRLKAREHQQAVVAQLVGQQALAGVAVSTLMNEAVTLVAQNLEVEYCKIFELLPDGQAFLLRAGIGWQEGLVNHVTVGTDLDSQAGYTLLSQEPVIVEDLRQETRFRGSALLHNHGVVSGMTVVIHGIDQPFGVLGADTTRRRTFTEDDTNFLQAVANVLSTAIERKKTEEKLQQAHDKLEIEVALRTAELSKINQQLQTELSEHKRTEALLQESEERFRSAFENAAIGKALVAIDGRWLRVNRSLCEIVGYCEAELLATTFQAITHPDDLDIDLDYVRQVLSDKIRYYEMEKRYFHKQGHIVWILLSGSLVRDTEGKPLYFIAQIQDITRRKQAELALRDSERRFRAIFDQTFQFIGLLKPDGTLLEANQTALDFSGISHTDIVDRPFWEARWWTISTKTQNQLKEAIARAATGEFVRYEVDVLGRGDTVATIDFSLKPVVDETRNVILLIPEGRDISERKRVEKMKNEFISVVSHELRTPLSSIRGSLGLLASRRLDSQPQKQERMLEIAVAETERLTRLVNDILDLERLESGKIVLEKTSCDTATLMLQSVEVLRLLAEESKITLNISPLSVQVWADSDRIIQVLVNILGNAVKFSPAGSTVWLSAELSQNPILNTPQVLFQVKDQGRGIPTDKLESIFRRFQQVDASDSRSKGGTGLGLAICRSIVKQHGGQIWVQSVLGQGSTFYFTLPVLPK